MYKIPFKTFENTDKFRPAAIHFQQYGYYTSAPKGTTAYREYWDEERKRCLYGYAAEDGERVTGYHYFYLNYCPIVLVKEIESINNKGEEVIYPNPGFPIYESVINFVGAKAVPLPLLEEKNFSFDIRDLKKAITNLT